MINMLRIKEKCKVILYKWNDIIKKRLKCKKKSKRIKL